MNPATRDHMITALRAAGASDATIAAYMAGPDAERTARTIEAMQRDPLSRTPAERLPDRFEPAPEWASGISTYAGDGLPVQYAKEYDR